MTKKKRKYSVRVHPAGAVMLLLAILFCESHLVIAAVLALLLHEGAHMLLMRICGVQETAIELTPFGGMADVRSFERLPPIKQIMIAAAGVAVSVAATFLSLKFAPRTPFWHAFFNINASLAMINCLPVWPLDGARIVMAAAMHFGAEKTVRKIMLWLAYLLGACLVALGLYGAWLGYVNFSLLLLGPYLWYAAHQSAVVQNFRHMERANAAREKLANGAVMPARPLAVSSEPTKLELMRLMLTMPPQQFHLLYVVDGESGEVKKIITEQEMAQRLFM